MSDEVIELKPVVTPEDAARRMQEIGNAADPETSHTLADELLCSILQQHGYSEVVTAFRRMTKWYA